MENTEELADIKGIEKFLLRGHLKGRETAPKFKRAGHKFIIKFVSVKLWPLCDNAVDQLLKNSLEITALDLNS